MFPEFVIGRVRALRGNRRDRMLERRVRRALLTPGIPFKSRYTPHRDPTEYQENGRPIRGRRGPRFELPPLERIGG